MIFKGMKIGSGNRLQSGIPRWFKGLGPEKANGLLLPGVVVSTYVTDTTGHPQENDEAAPPTAVYCDVLIYPGLAYQRWFGLRHVLVSQDRGGMHRGSIWKPRACTIDLTQELDSTATINNPAYLDGDHVLIGFLNDSLSQPIIIRGLPHPSIDLGKEEESVGRRMRLKLIDGDPEFWRHHGTHWGVNSDGDFVVDTRWANDGELDDAGKESDPPTDGKGAVTHSLPQDATYSIVLYDMTDPSAPNEVMKTIVQKDKLKIQISQGESLLVQKKDDTAELILGDGAVKVAVADHLKTLYTSLKTGYDSHTHTAPPGGGATTPPVSPAPAWDDNIESSQVKIPDTIPP
jgi:hypothetical protein